ncbi:MAG: hypothetical protein A3A51_00285 [Candidatus Levybacteria bacterium RIFCSPLOWO2_01_FULL_39_10]|nr:MAG: hypothetical protein A3A51_00285 [Candidatus Levybacteria bacterium RIFCSPLOWO2_01_FULL_39_10]
MKDGEGLLLIPVLEVKHLVDGLREKYDPGFLREAPPHITILYPFKRPRDMNIEDIKKLNSIFEKVEKFTFSLQKINTFPNVVYLEPSESENFINLTRKVVEMFPNYPPYEGKFEGITPHLTIGQELEERTAQVLDETKSKLEKRLPINSEAKEVWLMEKVNGKWVKKRKFNFLL